MLKLLLVVFVFVTAFSAAVEDDFYSEIKGSLQKLEKQGIFMLELNSN